MSSKSLINQLFLYESLFSYILAVCVWIFRPKFKKQDFEVISGYLEKRITVRPMFAVNNFKTISFAVITMFCHLQEQEKNRKKLSSLQSMPCLLRLFSFWHVE